MSAPTLAVWKFASCDGCQLTLLDCEDELLTIAGAGADRHLPRSVQRDRRRALRRVARGGLDHHRRRRAAHQGDPRRSPRPWSPSAPARPAAGCRRCATSPTSTSSPPSSTPSPNTSTRWPRPLPPRHTSRSTTSCRVVRSTAASCSTRLPRCWSDVSRGCPPRPCAPSARTAG